MRAKGLFWLLCGAGIAVATSVIADYRPFRDSLGGDVQPFVLHCASGIGNGAVPCGGPGSPLRALLMPFARVVMDPYVFTVTATASTYAIVKPPGATSYRFVNPCDVDVRIRKVATMQESITTAQGTLYLARTSEVVGTSSPEFVSLIAMTEPTKPCRPELQYGDGS